MQNENKGSRWKGLVALRDDFDRESVAIPVLRNRIDEIAQFFFGPMQVGVEAGVLEGDGRLRRQ